MKTILKEILKEQKKTNKMLQTIVSSKEQSEIVKINIEELVNVAMPAIIKKLNKIPNKSSRPKITGE